MDFCLFKSHMIGAFYEFENTLIQSKVEIVATTPFYYTNNSITDFPKTFLLFFKFCKSVNQINAENMSVFYICSCKPLYLLNPLLLNPLHLFFLN